MRATEEREFLPDKESWSPVVIGIAVALILPYVLLADGSLWSLLLLAIVISIALTGAGGGAGGGTVEYQDDTTKIKAQGDGVKHAAKIIRTHQKQKNIIRICSLILSIGSLAAAILLALYGPADRQYALSITCIGLIAISAMLLGYSINLKLMGVISIGSKASGKR